MRREDLPELTFRESIEGYGNLSGNGVDLPVRFHLSREKYAAGTPATLQAWLSGESSNLEKVIKGGWPVLTGTTNRGERIEIPRVLWSRASGDKLQAEVYELDVNMQELPHEPANQFVSVLFTETPIARPRLSLVHSYTGEIASHGEGYEPFHLSTRLGKCEFSRVYLYEDVIVEKGRATVQISRPQLSLEVPPEHRSKTVSELAESLEGELRDFARLLSLLSREHLDWLEIRITSEGAEGEKPWYADSKRWHRTITTLDDPPEWSFVNAYIMKPDALDEMLSRYRSLEFADATRRAIGF